VRRRGLYPAARELVAEKASETSAAVLGQFTLCRAIALYIANIAEGTAA
jgi:hypothetical protein